MKAILSLTLEGRPRKRTLLYVGKNTDDIQYSHIIAILHLVLSDLRPTIGPRTSTAPPNLPPKEDSIKVLSHIRNDLSAIEAAIRKFSSSE